MSKYNGWKNYETWNVALWIRNDETLYAMAKRFNVRGYKAFVKNLSILGSELSEQTPDEVRWDYKGLDIDTLDEMMGEL